MKAWWALLLVLPLSAHTISMSHGLVRVDGTTVTYQLRMPTYELAHVNNPEQALFSAVQFVSGGVEGKMITRSCHDDPRSQALICDTVYQFPNPIDTLTVHCTLARVTVPNHIHLLRAAKGPRFDQAVFDGNIETAELRFRPPTAFESAIKNIAAGVIRAATSFLALLFLAALAVAARNPREFGAILLSFLTGQSIACAVLPHIRFDPSPRFIEIAMLLTIGYLLVEIIFLPDGSARWMVCGVLGIFHGLYYALLLREGGFSAPYVLAGVFAVEIAAAALCYLVWSRVRGPLQRLVFRSEELRSSSSAATKATPSR